MPIKSFRGRLENMDVRKIRLSTNNGMTGYKITKFSVMPTTDADIESTVLVKSVNPGSASSTIDFEDPLLLAAAYYSQAANAVSYPEDLVIFFDNKVFNQDIYISLKGHNYTADLNYYLELETVRLDKNEQAVVTLRDIRANIT
jgi:hypothetical protein